MEKHHHEEGHGSPLVPIIGLSITLLLTIVGGFYAHFAFPKVTKQSALIMAAVKTSIPEKSPIHFEQI